jgi:ferritin-like metal-binding protein YciE
MKQLISIIKFIKQRAQQSELELYIESRKPSTNADVERLTREFQMKQMFRNFA